MVSDLRSPPNLAHSSVPERMSQVSRRLEVGNHKRRTVLRWALLSNGYFVHFLTLCL